jgi:hypothetical protein
MNAVCGTGCALTPEQREFGGRGADLKPTRWHHGRTRRRRCGSLMLPWTAELCLDCIGREAL